MMKIDLSSLFDFVFVFVLVSSSSASSCCAMAMVLMRKENLSLSFPSAEAAFAKHIPGHGVYVDLLFAIPSDGCLPLTVSPSNSTISRGGGSPPSSFVVISRGNCSFTTKVVHAQNAGFGGAIIYNNIESSSLITMAGRSEGIHIYALFVSESTGKNLGEYSECWIFPSIDNTSWSAMIISVVAVLAVSVVVGSFMLVRQRRRRLEALTMHPQFAQFMNIRSQVKSMPVVVFKGVANASAMEDICTICLEDYVHGERLRILPCSHRFHVSCIDSWLTTWQPFCPLCRCDSRTNIANLAPSEGTPLVHPPLPISRLQADNASNSRPILSISSPSSPQSPHVHISTNDPHLLNAPLSPYGGSLHQSSPYQRMMTAPLRQVSGSPVHSMHITPCSSSSHLASNSLEAFRASPYFLSLSLNPSSLSSTSHISSTFLD